MEITVLVPGVLRGETGGESKLAVDLADGTRLGGLLDELARRHPRLDRRLRDEHGVLRRHVHFYLDGTECRRLDGPDTVLTAGSELHIIPSVAGG
jgi:sulfur-carrier protein